MSNAKIITILKTKDIKGGSTATMLLTLAIGAAVIYGLMYFTGSLPGKKILPSSSTAATPMIIQTRNGDTFTLSVESNPTTGYQWSAEFDAEYVQPVGKRFEPGAPGSLGSGGKEHFDFLALQPGQISVKLVYRRSWEKNTAPLKTLTYQIDIQ